ncbi:MAG: TspO/MBR family protein [Candidatus Paceibacteria bacterium]
MTFKPNYLTIPGITLTVSVLGNFFTSAGIESGWYDSIATPSWTPNGSVIGLVWTVIFILTTISALIIWNRYSDSKNFSYIIGLFIVNAFLNFTWSFLFFTVHFIGAAFIDAFLIAVSVAALIYLIWPRSKIAALLLAPYFLWVGFATYLNYIILVLN